MNIPTVAQFDSLTGRSGVGRIFKTKSDFQEIKGALRAVQNAAHNLPAKLDAVRRLRRGCISWLTANARRERASQATILSVLDSTKPVFVQITNDLFRNEQSSSGDAVATIPVPQLAFGRELLQRHGAGARDVPRVGNSLDSHYAREMQARHWGPTIAGAAELRYQVYRAHGGLLSIGAFVDRVFLINMEDDPTGMYLGGGNSANVDALRHGVTYCDETQRESYALTIQNGRIHDASGNLFDTSSRETAFSGHGWAIFVLGFDNRLYANSHIVNMFHHSSFFAGGPVQCGGELCCIAGRLRYITSKTGHYKSGRNEFYRVLSFLEYQGVVLNNALAAADIRANQKYFRASAIYHAHGKEPGDATPVLTTSPPKLTAPGVPHWPAVMGS